MIDYRILPEHGLMLVCIWGTTSLADVQNMRQVYRTDKDYSPDFSAFVDMSRTDIDFTVEEMKTLAKRFVILAKPVKVAVFSPLESTNDLLREFEKMTEPKRGGDIRSFQSKADALKWLGLEHVDTEAVCQDMITNCRFSGSSGLS